MSTLSSKIESAFAKVSDEESRRAFEVEYQQIGQEQVHLRHADVEYRRQFFGRLRDLLGRIEAKSGIRK